MALALLGWCWRGWQGRLVQAKMGKSVIFGGLGERGDGAPKGGEGNVLVRWVLQAEGDKVTAGVGFVAPAGLAAPVPALWSVPEGTVWGKKWMFSGNCVLSQLGGGHAARPPEPQGVVLGLALPHPGVTERSRGWPCAAGTRAGGGGAPTQRLPEQLQREPRKIGN